MGAHCCIWKKDVLLCVGVATYGRHRGRIYIIFLRRGEGALIKLQYALQKWEYKDMLYEREIRLI